MNPLNRDAQIPAVKLGAPVRQPPCTLRLSARKVVWDWDETGLDWIEDWLESWELGELGLNVSHGSTQL